MDSIPFAAANVYRAATLLYEDPAACSLYHPRHRHCSILPLRSHPRLLQPDLNHFPRILISSIPFKITPRDELGAKPQKQRGMTLDDWKECGLRKGEGKRDGPAPIVVKREEEKPSLRMSSIPILISFPRAPRAMMGGGRGC